MKKYICQFKKVDPSANFQSGVRTIQTIKLLRGVTSCGLKQAKSVIDGKLALMDGSQVLDFIDLHCDVDQGATMSAGPQFGFEYTVLSSTASAVKTPPSAGLRYSRTRATTNAEPTGYFFVVHREA